VRTLVIHPASVRLNNSRDSDWAETVLQFVADAAAQGKTVMVSADEKLFSPQQAADLARVSRMTIQRRIADGTIRAVKHGSRWRIAESELDRYRQQIWSETVVALANEF
jgi:excisionase family DNA binding protein